MRAVECFNSLIIGLLLIVTMLPPACSSFISNVSAWKSGWLQYKQRLSGTLISSKPLSSLLPPSFFDYEFTLPEPSLRAGIPYISANYRLRDKMSRAISGRRPLKVGFVGGSISTGHGESDEQVTAWIPTFKRWLERAFPGISVRNGCIAGTPSAYMVVCLEMSVDPDVDVVFSEYILNDGMMDSIVGNINVKETERLVRR